MNYLILVCNKNAVNATLIIWSTDVPTPDEGDA